MSFYYFLLHFIWKYNKYTHKVIDLTHNIEMNHLYKISGHSGLSGSLFQVFRMSLRMDVKVVWCMIPNLYETYIATCSYITNLTYEFRPKKIVKYWGKSKMRHRMPRTTFTLFTLLICHDQGLPVGFAYPFYQLSI